MDGLGFQAITGIPEISAGDDLAGIILHASAMPGNALQQGDILCLAQKVVSKAEGRIIDLRTVTPSAVAKRLAGEVDKDPRLIELILSESVRIVAYRRGVIIVEHKCGLVLANAGIDHSNVPSSGSCENVLLLPKNPNASASRLHRRISSTLGMRIGIIITDSVGRPWRLGTVGIAIGCCGVRVLHDLRGERDMYGHTLQVSETAEADCIAAAATLVMGEAAEATPVVRVRGMPLPESTQNADTLKRAASEDLFRGMVPKD